LDKDAQPSWFSEIAPPQAQRVVKLPKRKPRRAPSAPMPVWEDTGPTAPHPLADMEPLVPNIDEQTDGDMNKNGFDLQLLPGVTDTIAEKMKTLGLDSADAINSAGIDGLTKIKGIGPAKADTILQALQPQTQPEIDILKEMERLLSE